MTRDQFRPDDHDADHFLLTTLVGSYPQPEWLGFVRDAHTEEEISEETLTEAVDDACRATITELEQTGLDVLTDGEVRREGMVEYFTQYINNMESAGSGSGSSSDWNARMPTVSDTVSADGPWLIDDYEFATSVTDRPVKVTITGPFTLASFSSPQGYDSVQDLAYDFADLVADEVERLADAGVTWIQVDEPGLGVSPHDQLAHECLDRVAERVPDDVRFGVHICSGNYSNLAPEMFAFPADELSLEFASDDADDPATVFEGYNDEVDIAFGVVTSHSKSVESVETIQDNIEEAISILPHDRVTISPDCGMQPLPRDVAYGKLENMVEAARNVEEALDAGQIEPAS